MNYFHKKLHLICPTIFLIHLSLLVNEVWVDEELIFLIQMKNQRKLKRY